LKRKNQGNNAPEAIGQILERLIPRLGLEEMSDSSRVFTLWDSVVGNGIARHARPHSFRKGVLIVHVDSSVWLSQLERFRKEQIRRKLNQELGGKRIGKIIFRIGRSG